MQMRDLSFSDGPMFGRVMEDVDICREVIERILDVPMGPVELVDIEHVIEPALWHKGVRMDVFVRTIDGLYNVEMQTYRRSDLGRRIRYYQAAIDVAELHKGRSYEALPESYIVVLCDFDPFDGGCPVYTFEARCLEDPDVPLGHGCHWLLLNATAWSGMAASPLRNLLQYVATGTAGEDDLVARIARAVQRGNEDARWKEQAMQILTYEEDLAMQWDILKRKMDKVEQQEDNLALREGDLALREDGLALREGDLKLREGDLNQREDGLDLREDDLKLKEKALNLREGELHLKEEEMKRKSEASERDRYGTLVRTLLEAHREGDLLRASDDAAYLQALYREFHL